MIMIEKSKYIRKCLTITALMVIIYSTFFCYFLGFKISVKSILILVLIIFIEIILLVMLYFILNKFNQCAYVFTDKSVKLYSKNKEIFTLNKEEIISMVYIRYKWIFLGQIGAGYLNIGYNEDKENIKPSIKAPTGIKIYSISMSQKQAIQISNIMHLTISVK